jgi:dienelactone hydrolase
MAQSPIIGIPVSDTARPRLCGGFSTVDLSSSRRCGAAIGATGGDWAEGIAHKPGDDYFRPGLETARDIAATVDYATALPFAQSRAAVVIGHSGGGWGTIAYDSIPHPRVTALISMAGGRGMTITDDGVRRPELGVWRPDLLIDAAGRFGQTATTPMLWVYSENDSLLAPALAASLYDAFTRTGGKAELVQVGSYGNDGHRFFFGPGGSQIWGPPVANYLARQSAQERAREECGRSRIRQPCRDQ